MTFAHNMVNIIFFEVQLSCHHQTFNTVYVNKLNDKLNSGNSAIIIFFGVNNLDMRLNLYSSIGNAYGLC